MAARFIPATSDPIAPETPEAITITVDGVEVHGFLGQTLAGMLLATDTPAWRRTSFGDRPRGAFCGIGVCFDCLVVVNGQRDVRACQRRAASGDRVVSHRDQPILLDRDESGGAR